MYPSTSTTQASSRQGGYTKGYAPPVPQGFIVRVVKGPSVYSFPQTTQSHFDRGYQSIPLSEPRQNNNNLNWYTRAQSTTSAPTESQTTSRPPTSSGISLPNDPRLVTGDPGSRSKSASYSIYPSTNDTFVYESSLSSKADLSSSSEDGDSNFSPAMSTDSITTVRGANTPDVSSTDLPTSTPASAPTSSSSRIPFPLNIPSLAQAQTAIKGIFRSQAQNDSQSAASSSFSASSGTLARPSATKPIRVSETTSRSGDRDSGITQHHTNHSEHALSGDNAHSMESRSPISDDEDSEADLIAKANAEYNAAASKAGSSVTYYSSARDSVHPNSTAMRNATGPLHPNLTIRSGPEQYHTQATTPQAQPSYWGAPEMTRPHSMANGHTSHFPSGDPLASTAQIPLSQSSGPSGRYIPASQTMIPEPLNTLSEPTANRERYEHNKYVPSSATRERKTSVSRVSPTITASQIAVHREGGGASASRSVPSTDESRRGSVGRQAPYAPYRADPPASQEPSAFIAAHQAYNAPTTHHATATIQSNHNIAPEANPWYMASTATRPSGSVISHTSDHRTSPEQGYMYASQQPVPQLRSFPAAPPSGERASKYVSSASTRGTSTSPPRTRQDSTAAFNNGLYTRSSNVETSNTLTLAQGRPQQDMRTRQDYLYEPQNSQIDDARNPRGREYGSRLETDRAMADPYSRTSERQASYVSNTYPQRGPATTITSSSSASTRGRPETPAVPDPSQIPFPPPVREPQRRYSDGDTSSQSTYGPAASTSGANVPPGSGVARTVTEALRATEPQSQRRYSDGESNIPDRAPLTLFRTVRWNENLICPSPIFPHQRRKGWFNRRGDQLWTNDGAYKPPAQGQEYPPDLDGYPEHGDGWMNEQGTRIDIAHRLIPKVPLKSALKTSRPQSTTAQQEN